MDHLPAPRFCRASEVVPYICSKPYDGRCFLEYPMRENKPYMLPSLDGLLSDAGYLLHENQNPTPNSELEDIFQRWLFFGLLNEFLGDQCNPESFIRRSGDATATVSTSCLLDLIDPWVEMLKGGTTSLTYSHIARCLRIVFTTLRAAGPSFNPIIKLSIASIGEMFELAVNEAFETNLIIDNECPGTWRTLIDDGYWMNRMRQSGWCPSQINVTLNAFLYLQVRLYLSIS